MRHLVPLLALALPLLAGDGAAAWAQGPGGFEDIPPWHWAYEAVGHLTEEGIVQGFPRNDRDLALNAVVQVYEAFAHARHPAARGWAERFLANLPPTWPRALDRSDVVAFDFTDAQVRLTAERGAAARGTVTLRVDLRVRRRYIALPVGVKPPAQPPVVSVRQRVVATVMRDTAGRWRVDYASLAAAQPEIFRW